MMSIFHERDGAVTVVEDGAGHAGHGLGQGHCSDGGGYWSGHGDGGGDGKAPGFGVVCGSGDPAAFCLGVGDGEGSTVGYWRDRQHR